MQPPQPQPKNRDTHHAQDAPCALLRERVTSERTHSPPKVFWLRGRDENCQRSQPTEQQPRNATASWPSIQELPLAVRPVAVLKLVAIYYELTDCDSPPGLPRQCCLVRQRLGCHLRDACYAGCLRGSKGPLLVLGIIYILRCLCYFAPGRIRRPGYGYLYAWEFLSLIRGPLLLYSFCADEPNSDDFWTVVPILNFSLSQMFRASCLLGFLSRPSFINFYVYSN